MRDVEYDPLTLFEEFVERFREDPQDPELEAIDKLLAGLGYAIKIAEGEFRDEEYSSDTPPRYAVKISILKDNEEIGDVILESWDYAQLPTTAATRNDLAFLRAYYMRLE